jgi:arylsulfatase A-like enzyme
MPDDRRRDDLQRGILPIPDRRYPGMITYDAKDSDTAFPPIVPLRPPASAPNVLLVLLDDVGFGASSAFGGPVQMPTAERLAAEGLRYTRFHTTALCSPTRAALLCGRNHHSVGMGGITEIATSAPGYDSIRPNSCAPLPEILRLNGYSTAQFGKCHEVPVWETSPAGPFDRWPSPGGGFEHFYGFIGGETNQYYPALHLGTQQIDPPATPEQGYHLMADLADRTIDWVRQQKALMPDKPFLVYFAPGATHTPHHVPIEWADKYAGVFDDGWDALRERSFAAQRAAGVIPADCDLTARPEDIPAWDNMPEDLKPVLRRQMENYAGFLEYADHHTGRVVDALEELGILDDTLVYYIIGDNGASAEGTINGTFNGTVLGAGGEDMMTAAYMTSQLDKWGGPESYPHYAVGWAHAMCTPYQWTKQVASHWGGTRNATIVRWPSKITDKGGIRNQFTHVIDVAPTVLECAAIPEPTQVHGVTQLPFEGVSMAYTFASIDVAERHETQYFEMFCNRGIYHKGWSAVTKHRSPWKMGHFDLPLDDDVWELYDGSKDWTQAHDLAASMPDKLHDLQRLFLIQAARFNVLPLDDRQVERLLPELAGRPTILSGTKQVLYPGMGGLNENCVLNVKNRSHSITAQVTIPAGGANGVLVNQGGITGGWVLYVKDNTLRYCYNMLNITRSVIRGGSPLPDGEHQVRAEFAYDGGGLGKGGNVTLYVDGEPVGDGRVDRTHTTMFSFDETTDVGADTGSPVTDDYPAEHNGFTGSIKWIEINLGDDDHNHLIDPDDVYRLMVIKQ